MAIWNPCGRQVAPWIIIPLCANFNMLDFLTVDPRVFFGEMGGNVREFEDFRLDSQWFSEFRDGFTPPMWRH